MNLTMAEIHEAGFNDVESSRFIKYIDEISEAVKENDIKKMTQSIYFLGGDVNLAITRKLVTTPRLKKKYYEETPTSNINPSERWGNMVAMSGRIVEEVTFIIKDGLAKG